MISFLAPCAQVSTSARDSASAGWPRSSLSVSASSASSVRSASPSSHRSRPSAAEDAGPDWCAERSAYSTGSVRTPWRRSVPGVLPDCADSLAMSITSSESCQATPICSQAAPILADTSAGAPANMAPNLPDVAISEPVFSVITRM
jgi:hypothetical protein